MRSTRWWGAAVLAAGTAAANAWSAQGNGLVPSQQDPWPRWQARLSLGNARTQLPLELGNAETAGLTVRGASLLGDYYFSRSLTTAGSSGGFRATSGVFFGSRSTALYPAAPEAGIGLRNPVQIGQRSIDGLHLPSTAENPPDAGAVPYVGVGYTGLLGKGSWGISADFGLMALNPGSVKLGRVFSGNQGLDESLRDMRLSPLLHLGVSYSF